jgi:peroxiredoxin
MDVTGEPYPKRRVDVMTGVMLVVTLAALAGTAWLRSGRSSATEASTATIGAPAPPLRLIDPETSEPVVLLGLKDKVVWAIFWSARSTTGPTCLAELELATKRLRSHRRLAVLTAAVESDDPAGVEKVVAAEGLKLPAYLADPETRRRFRAEGGDPPLHVLIDADGRVLAMARGDGRPTIDRIAEVARRRLDEIDPLGESRFAAREETRR